MAAVVWFTMGIALWHFTVFLPERFWQGIVGAFIGGWLFSAMGWGTPFGGIAGTIFVAFIGAVLLLAILRLIRRA